VLKLIKFLVLLVAATLGAAFAYINPGLVRLSYYFGEWELPLGILIFLLLGVGILIGFLACLGWFFRIRKENLALRRRSELASQEINNLRAMPLRDR
jgi:putative membrane protein